ncbi:L-asparaginase [Episyrphus balteatus]|uniref:L-asparaginase n=1 Tax=Episyrphus balteatus TaxID=286459 RepID=UPI00248654B1|nr:L-asparaginase [Episyrphus balteatus]XP_055843693.1 L-asparaginase [Episyrphus balteatus]
MSTETNETIAGDNSSENQPKLGINSWKPLEHLGDSLSPKNGSNNANMRRNASFGNMLPSTTKESKVRVIYTGGTIGMMRNESNVLIPIPNALVKMIRKYPNMHDQAYAEKRFGTAAGMAPLILPFIDGIPNRVVYTITEYNPLLDSSNMTTDDWVHIAKDIHQSYEFFDAFVVLHGTDTLAYTASALSFMLENLGKTVIITGSQIPIFDTRTDGKDNFTTALSIAGNYVIPEVCVLFGNKLMRGNRTIKVSCDDLNAFDSPNNVPIGRIGINYEIDYRLIFRPCNISRFVVHADMDVNVGLLRLFPSITSSTFRAFLAPPMKGVVLQSFGSGNIPSNRKDILEEIRAASERGVIIVNCTQCSNGSVAEIYDTGKVLKALGVVPGYDMTPEAAVTKLSYVLGKRDWTLEYKKQVMQSNIRGELTAESPLMEDYDLIEAVARSLHLSSPAELSQLGATLFPAMLNAAVLAGDIKKINSLKAYGADLSGVNHDNRTALHIACHEGNLPIVNLLLQHGVSVHIRDRYDRTPLMEAVSVDHHEIIQLLLSCGAHLTGSMRAIGEQLCSAAARGSLLRLQSFQLAGADLAQVDHSGRTALHVAALHGHVEIVEYLVKNYDDINGKDKLGLTALQYAKMIEHEEVIKLFGDGSS